MLKPAGLYGHIRQNTLKSVLLLLCLPVLIELLMVFWSVPISIGINQMYADVAKEMGHTAFPDRDVSDAVRISAGERYGRGWWVFFLNIALSLGITWFLSRYILRAKTGAKPVQRRSEPEFYNIVENLAITAGLPMPNLEIIETDAMNAYASGVGPKNSSLTVTRGLLNGLEDDELASVIAHELSHIKNHDARMMTIASTLVGAITGIWSIIWRFVIFPTPLKIILLLTMLPMVFQVATALALIGGAAIVSALIVRASISQARELMADAGAVELTKDGDALIRALRKISGNDEISTSDVTVQAMMFSWSPGGWFDAHPPLQTRIDALVAYAGAQGRKNGIIFGGVDGMVGKNPRYVRNGCTARDRSSVGAPQHLKPALAGYDGKTYFGARSDFSEMKCGGDPSSNAPVSFGRRVR